MTATIRLASSDDGAAIAAIYGPSCDFAVVSFEYAAPTATDMAGRIEAITAEWPWLVLDDGGVVAGYAYAGRHRERAAYGWTVEVAVYVSPSHQRRGVATALYTTLFQVLRLQGYFKVCAGVTLPNDASTGLHEAMGFGRVGVYAGIGYKHGAWHDVAHYQMSLVPERVHPAPPVPVSALVGTPAWEAALAEGLSCYDPRGAA
jgi:phosphinothricin acetyltransferase